MVARGQRPVAEEIREEIGTSQEAPRNATPPTPATGVSAPADHKRQHDQLTLDLDRRGNLPGSGSRVAVEKYIAREARGASAAAKKAGDHLPTLVVIRPDKDTPFGRLQRVVEVCRVNGFRRFFLTALGEQEIKERKTQAVKCRNGTAGASTGIRLVCVLSLPDSGFMHCGAGDAGRFRAEPPIVPKHDFDPWNVVTLGEMVQCVERPCKSGRRIRSSGDMPTPRYSNGAPLRSELNNGIRSRNP